MIAQNKSTECKYLNVQDGTFNSNSFALLNYCIERKSLRRFLSNESSLVSVLYAILSSALVYSSYLKQKQTFRLT
jgi:hypothetical protein